MRRHIVRSQVGPGDLGPEWRLRVAGLVSEPLVLDRRDVLAIASREAVGGGPNCPEGFGTHGGSFGGPSLLAVIAASGPLPTATHVSVQSGEFIATFALESLVRRGAVLATHRDGVELEWRTGGPVRLVPSHGACFDSVKWVERIWLDPDGSRATAVKLVKARRMNAGEVG